MSVAGFPYFFTSSSLVRIKNAIYNLLKNIDAEHNK